MFKIIQNCTTTKQAWELLHNHCEGDNSVKQTKLRMLWSKFENLRMEEAETIYSYFEKLLTLSNDVQLLGDAISNKQLISKAFVLFLQRANYICYPLNLTIFQKTPQIGDKYI